MHTLPSTDAPLTVVVTDVGSEHEMFRCLRQLAKHSPREVEIVAASIRTLTLPGALVRRVRRLRATSGGLLDAAVAAEAHRERLVVIATSSTAFSAGWVAEVRARAALHPMAVSEATAVGGGMLLYPSAATSESVLVRWLSLETIRVRDTRSGARPRQRLSAVMIVKDEEDVLDECLTAVAPFVDEIVVYDTGSTDTTLDIARSHGVVLVEGYWNDSFGDARNRALEHATGDWVLQVDADEVVTGDVEQLRDQLDHETYDQVSLTILSTTFAGATTGSETQPVRLFRRQGYHWTGALHEYPVNLPGTKNTGPSPRHAPLRLIHSGYQEARTTGRNKQSRNVELARAELAATSVGQSGRGELLSNLGRSLMWAGQVDEALECFDELRTTPTNPTAVVIAGRAAVDALIARGRYSQAEEWIDVLALNREAPGNVANMRAHVHLAAGDLAAADAALTAIEATGGGCDVWGVAFNPADAAAMRAAIGMQRGDADLAADELMGLVTTSPRSLNLHLLFTAFAAAGRPLAAVAGSAPEELLARSLRDAAVLHPQMALTWFAAFREAHPHDHRPVVAGCLFAARADWKTALTWSAYAREMGLTDVCALRGLADRSTAPLVDRCMSHALLAEVFGEPGAEAGFERTLVQLPVADAPALFMVLNELGISVVEKPAVMIDSPSAALR